MKDSQKLSMLVKSVEALTTENRKLKHTILDLRREMNYLKKEVREMRGDLPRKIKLPESNHLISEELVDPWSGFTAEFQGMLEKLKRVSEHPSETTSREDVENHMLEIMDECPVYYLPLYRRVSNDLERAGIKTAGSLMRLSHPEISEIRGIGKGSLANIAECRTIIYKASGLCPK